MERARSEIIILRVVTLTPTGMLFAIKHIRACDLVMPSPHEGQIHLILYVFDVYRAALGQTAEEGLADVRSQTFHHFTYATRGRGVIAFLGENGLVHGDVDLVRVERHGGAVTADDLIAGVCRCEFCLCCMRASDMMGDGCMHGSLPFRCVGTCEKAGTERGVTQAVLPGDLDARS